MKKGRKVWEEKEEKIMERKMETLGREKKVERRKKKILEERNSWEKERKKIVEYDDEIRQERECFNFNSCLSFFFFVLLHHSFSLVLSEEIRSE